MKRINQKIQEIQHQKRMGLMTHVVVGYPNLKETEELVGTMIQNGADFVELQIPFSDPIADGPIILKASDSALQQGTTIEDALTLAKNIRQKCKDTPLFFMGYTNSLLHYGIAEFIARAAKIGVDGCIIPDLPPEEPEGKLLIEECKRCGIAPIFIFAPTSTSERMQELTEYGKGFFYCTARTGVTGASTEFSEDLSAFLSRCKSITSLPLAVGFGISTPEHVKFLKEKADIAVVGSETLRILDREGIEAAGKFIASLRSAGQ